jgi:molybdopterin molybdotransferase
MGFQGREYSFDSPAAAVAEMIARSAGREDAARIARASEPVALNAARGRILAEAVLCDRDSPAFDHASMDGYAVRAADIRAAVAHARDRGLDVISLEVVGESRIGAAPPGLATPAHDAEPRAGALRIATGAPIPTGALAADAIIKREDVAACAVGARGAAAAVESITVPIQTAERLTTGDYVRHRGENARARDAVIAPGAVLTAASLGALAAVGCATPRVFKRLRVALITTGDELVAPHETPGPFQIRNSNTAAIAAILASHAWIEVVHPTHLHDDADLAGALRELTTSGIGAEAVILTGGVSMGHRDPVRAAVESSGAEIVFHGLPQRPGKPMLGAMLPRCGGPAVPIFGLPGNPVSALVTCTRIVLPVLATCAGAHGLPASIQPRMVRFSGDDGARIGLWWHRLVRLVASDDGVTHAEIADARGSGDVISAARSDGFVELLPARDPSAGTSSAALVPFYPWPA